MSASALITMVVVQVTVTIITAYFFRKVLKAPPKPDDSFKEEP